MSDGEMSGGNVKHVRAIVVGCLSPTEQALRCPSPRIAIRVSVQQRFSSSSTGRSTSKSD